MRFEPEGAQRGFSNGHFLHAAIKSGTKGG